MEQTNLTQKTPTAGEKFTNAVMREFLAEAGRPVAWGEFEKTLAQHLFLKVDSALKDAETKRQDKNDTSKAPFIWDNVNMRKLALDGVHRINLGLDALVPAHIYPIAYFNKRDKKYDIDLRIGFEGELYYKMKHATPKPIDIKCELVYTTDKFKAIKEFDKESYELEITNPFSRGEVIGGFGYIQYANNAQNKLVLVDMTAIKKARGCAQSDDFWMKWNTEMILKTVVHRVCKTLKTDPRSVNAASVAFVESQDDEADEKAIEGEIAENANKEVIDTTEYENITEYTEPIDTDDVEEAVQAERKAPAKKAAEPTAEQKAGF
jgi:recombination protein RecT